MGKDSKKKFLKISAQLKRSFIITEDILAYYGEVIDEKNLIVSDMDLYQQEIASAKSEITLEKSGHTAMKYRCIKFFVTGLSVVIYIIL